MTKLKCSRDIRIHIMFSNIYGQRHLHSMVIHNKNYKETLNVLVYESC